MQLYSIEGQSSLQIIEWESESALDDFLFANPEALSQALYPEEDNRLLPLARQFEHIDILYLRLPTNDNPGYGILICEDKKGSNPELRRTVLGQVIDYAATTHQMAEADFRAKLVEQLQKPDIRSVHERCMRSGALAQEDVNDCLQHAVEAQQNGNIECVICAKTMPEQLLRMVKFVNAAKQGQADTRLLNACKVEKWQGNEVTIATVASMLAILEESDVAAFPSVDDENLLKKAVRIAELPSFNIWLAEILRTESIAILDAPILPPILGVKPKSNERIVDVDKCLSGMPEPIHVLYKMLDNEITLKKHWRPGQGTGSQLVLEVLISEVAHPLHILRLKQSGVSFVMFHFLKRNGLGEIYAWARHSLANMGIKDSEAKQPSLSLKEIAKLPKGNSSIILFVNELCDRVQKALALS